MNEPFYLEVEVSFISNWLPLSNSSGLAQSSYFDVIYSIDLRIQTFNGSLSRWNLNLPIFLALLSNLN